jgi:endonuclease YncB( thermonuclease family)
MSPKQAGWVVEHTRGYELPRKWRPSSVAATILAIALAPALDAETFSGKVVGVSDGDTISVLRDGRAVKVRLHGIDCPESRQAFGQRAKQFSSGLVFGQRVTVEVRARDRYGRLVGRVFAKGAELNLELVRAGLAWHYKRYSDDPALAEAERAARAAKRGLWRDPSPVPPWEFRRSRTR